MKNEKGFTLIEIILSVIVLAIAFTGVWKMFDVPVAREYDSERVMTASFLVRKGMEELIAKKKLQGFAGLPVGDATVTLPAPYDGFQQRTHIYYADDEAGLAETASATNYKKVEVSILWNAGANPSGLWLTTLVTNWSP